MDEIIAARREEFAKEWEVINLKNKVGIEIYRNKIRHDLSNDQNHKFSQQNQEEEEIMLS